MRARMEAEVDHGSRSLRHGEPRLAPGHAARGREHAAPVGIAHKRAVAASRFVVATADRRLTPIALRAQPARIERRCPGVLPTLGSRRSAASSLPRRIAVNSRRAITRRGNAKPFRVDPCASKPSGETHLHSFLSCASVLDVRDRDTKGFACAGTAFWKAGNVFRA